MLSWKLWRMAGTHLVSPWASSRLPTAYVVLPVDGVMKARCAVSDHVPPQEGCTCGLYSIPDGATMLRYKNLSGAVTPYRYALTYGIAEGRVVSGHFGNPAMTPMPGVCAATYRVRAILTEDDGRDLTHYGVPVYRSSFTLANMREVERRM